MNFQITPHMQKRANAIARHNGHGKATKIVLGSEAKVVDHTPYGYRKKTTHQYVPRSYVNKAWSSVYYQHAETTVSLPFFAKD